MNRRSEQDAYSLLRVAVRRLSTGTLIDQIRWSADMEQAAEWDLGQRIALARRNNLLTWNQIASAVGTTPQSAHHRFRKMTVEDEGFALEVQRLMMTQQLLDDELRGRWQN